MTVAMHYATRFAKGPAAAIRLTKRGINQYLRLSGVFLQDYAWAMQAHSALSGERLSAPHTEFPPPLVP